MIKLLAPLFQFIFCDVFEGEFVYITPLEKELKGSNVESLIPALCRSLSTEKLSVCCELHKSIVLTLVSFNIHVCLTTSTQKVSFPAKKWENFCSASFPSFGSLCLASDLKKYHLMYSRSNHTYLSYKSTSNLHFNIFVKNKHSFYST